MPNNYLFKKGIGRLLIIKFNQNEEFFLDLFSYTGACNIISATLIDTKYNKQQLSINENYITTWNRMTTTLKQDGTQIVKTWENLSDNYEKLDGSLRNDGYIATIYIDDGTNTNTEIEQ